MMQLFLFGLLSLSIQAAEAKPLTVLFTGSSTIEIWQKNLRRDFPDYNAVGEGKSGSDLAWLIQTAQDSVRKHDPGAVVIYSGDNDLANKNTPETVAANFERVVQIIRDEKPQVPVHILSVKPAPGRRELLPLVRETNRLLRAAAARLHKVYYVDVFSRMISAKGEIDPRHFDPEDPMKIHLSPAGYALWTKVLQDSLRRHHD